jgi:hypothetical protein
LGIEDEYYGTDKTFSGSIALGIKFDQKIIYFNGKMAFTSCSISGNGIFIATDNIIYKGLMSITYIESDKVALYSAKDFIAFDTESRLYGQIFVNVEVLIKDYEF